MICLSWNGCLCIYFLQWISNQCIHFKLFVFIFWPHCVFIAVCGLFLVVMSRGYSSLQCTGFSLQWLLSWSTDYRAGVWGRRQWVSGPDTWCLSSGVKLSLCSHPDSPRTKASGRSWVLLKQRDKVPTPEVKEDFLSLHEQEVAWGVEKWGDPTP